MNTWMLYFSDRNRPAGKRCLGVAIFDLESESVSDAVRRAWDLDINPGGEVFADWWEPGSLPPIPPALRDRLISATEAEEAGLIQAAAELTPLQREIAQNTFDQLVAEHQAKHHTKRR